MIKTNCKFLCARQYIFGIKNGMARRKASLLTAPAHQALKQATVWY